MHGQVVGFFDTRSDAEHACNELQAAGFSGSAIDTFEGGEGRTEEGGLLDKLKQFFGSAGEEDRSIYAEATRRGEIAVAVNADNEQEVDRAADILQRHNAVDLDRQVEQWKQEGWEGYQTRTSMAPTQPDIAATQPARSSEQEVLPVTEEQLLIGKRQILKGGVRLHTRVTETPVQEQVQLREEHIQVERRPVDRPVQPGDQAFQERTIEAREMAEEAVVEKQARVVEVVTLRKDAQERTETIHDTVRRTDVETEPLGGSQDTEFADRYAMELSRDERYRGSDWARVEPHARRDFEQRYPGYSWERFKDAISRSYGRIRRDM